MDNMKVMLVLDVRRRLCILYVFTFVFLRIIVSPNSLLHFSLSMGRNRRVLSKQHIHWVVRLKSLPSDLVHKYIPSVTVPRNT